MRYLLLISIITAMTLGCNVLGDAIDDPPGDTPENGDWDHPDYVNTVVVSNITELENAVTRANSEDNLLILLNDGTYQLNDMLWVEGDNIGFRSQSGNRDNVIIRGDGMTGSVSHVFNATGDYFSAEDITIGWVANHGAQIHGNNDADYAHFANVRFVNTGEQMLKVSTDFGSNFADNGIVENCSFEYTAGIGPQYYIGGIDCHQGNNWIIRDCFFSGIRSPEADLAEHAIHFWSDSSGTLIERNVITNCDRGVGFGMGDSGHSGGTIRNNFVHTTRDVGIGLENASGVSVYNNTVYTQNYSNSIEYRFGGTSGGEIINNLTNAGITARDGGSATVRTNVTNAQPSYFVDATSGDLHLSSSISGVVNAGETISSVTDDIDEEARPNGSAYDVGADETSY